MTFDTSATATMRVRSLSSAARSSTVHRPCSSTRTARSRAPVLAASRCQGMRLAWCSASVTTISSPGSSAKRARGAPAEPRARVGDAEGDHVDRVGGVLGPDDLALARADESRDGRRGRLRTAWSSGRPRRSHRGAQARGGARGTRARRRAPGAVAARWRPSRGRRWGCRRRVPGRRPGSRGGGRSWSSLQSSHGWVGVGRERSSEVVDASVYTHQSNRPRYCNSSRHSVYITRGGGVDASQ